MHKILIIMLQVISDNSHFNSLWEVHPISQKHPYIGVLKIYSKFTREHPCRSCYFNESAKQLY